MNPFFERLRAEHQHGLKQLALLDEAAAQLAESGYSADAHGVVRDAVRFINNDVRAHNEREEQYLFPEMERVIPPNGPTAVMKTEHRMLWETLDRIEKALPDVSETSTPEQLTELHHSASAVVQLLSDHIAKEDNILFPMAEAHLSEAQMRRLADIDAELRG